MLFLVLLLWAASDGFGDALFYARLGADAFPWNEHGPLVGRRALVLLAALAAAGEAVLIGQTWAMWWMGTEVAAAILAFSLFHNEAYNFGRVLIREQTMARAWAVFEFNYQSPSTSARFDFDGPARWWLAGAGGLVLTGGLLLLYFLEL